MHSTITITQFFNEDYVNQASYDNLRKIASVVDGQKNAARKILYTVLEKNIKEKIKVSQLGSKVAEYAEYLHGNLDGVIVNLAQDFIGTNNIPLLKKKGNFGTRFSQEASAARYIYSYGTDDFFSIFNKEDTPILKHQFFEGTQIEPMFYVPSIPILLINGSEGVSSGFAQKILPRNPELIKKHLINALQGKKNDGKAFVPYYNGFKGVIEQGENSAQWLIKGVVQRLGANKVQITEVPIGYDLKGYISVLDELEEKTIIQGYRDKSEDDNFLFEVQIPSKSLKEWDDEELLNKLKLIKKVTENYTVIDENNKIQVYDTAEDLLNKFASVKLCYMGLRKDNLIKKITEEITYDYSKYIFVKMIVEDKLILAKRKKDDIIKDISKIKEILKKSDSYDYLLRLPIINITEEEMIKLENKMKASKKELEELTKTSEADLWLNDLKE